MNLLYISYWGSNDPLTIATVFPNLKQLSQLESITNIILVTIEREDYHIQNLPEEFDASKVKHIPLRSKKYIFNILSKISDFIIFPRQLQKLISETSIEYVLARGAPAGALAYLAVKDLDVPFSVESYEPHADYMKFSSTWKWYDPRYIFQKFWEYQQKKKAEYLITVSENYKAKLLQEGVGADRVFVSPCHVDLNKFYLNDKLKEKIRAKLNISPAAIVGVYSGKFGDLYYDDEAFDLFAEGFKFFPEFHLILLTNQKTHAEKQLRKRGFESKNFTITFAAHDEVPLFLNASDFAFAPIKTLPVSRYQSPVKIGEYLACGLPLFLSVGVGDDSSILQRERVGVILKDYSLGSIIDGYEEMNYLINSNISNKCRKIAEKYRSSEINQNVYLSVFK